MALPQNPPVINKAAADKNKAASAIHMQEQFKAGAAPQDTSTIQKLGAAFTGEQRAQDVAATGAEAAKAVGTAERDFELGELERAEQNIKDQEQLTKAIEDQKNKLVDRDIGITEDEFADKQLIQKLNEEQDFHSETQFMDLARLQIDSDEDYQDMLLDSEQRVLTQQNEDEWELDVYNRAMADKDMLSKLQKDAAKMQEIENARRAAEEKAKQAAAKAGKQRKMIAVAKVGAGVGMMYVPGGQAAGASMAAGGASDFASESQA
jgi:hypothetical protein